MSTGTMKSIRPEITSCISQINWRINWCRLQQQLKTVTWDEREGWWAEEAGLVDALLGRDRTGFMRDGHRSQFTRYLCGLDDGQTLLCLQHSKPLWDEAYGGVGPSPLKSQARVGNIPH